MTELTPKRGLIKQDSDSYADVSELTHNFRELDTVPRLEDEHGNYVEPHPDGFLKTNPELVYERTYQTAGSGTTGQRLAYITEYGTLGTRTEHLFRGDGALKPGLKIAKGKVYIMPTISDGRGAKIGYVEITIPVDLRDYDGVLLSTHSSVPNVIHGRPALFFPRQPPFVVTTITIAFKRSTDVGTGVEWIIWKEM